MRTPKELQAWLASLEAERHDRSYLKPATRSYQPEVIYRDKPIDHRQRDSAMFHAGRYAEGARDLEAVRANKTVAKLLKGKK